MLALADKTGLTLSVVRKWLWDKEERAKKHVKNIPNGTQIFKVTKERKSVADRSGEDINLEPY